MRRSFEMQLTDNVIISIQTESLHSVYKFYFFPLCKDPVDRSIARCLLELDVALEVFKAV